MSFSVQHDVRVHRQVIDRRCFLRQTSAAGLASFGALSFRDALNARAEEIQQAGYSVILLWMQGGPSQFETFDPKPDTANGGPTKAISTAVSGIQIAQGWNKVAGVMNDISLIRSMTNKEGQHARATYQMHTGYVPTGTVKHPSFGCAIAKEIAPEDLAFPSVVGIAGGADGGQANAQGVAISVPNYAVNMPAAVGSGTGGAIGLTLGSLGGAANLNLRLSAAEQEGTVKIVSSPKVLTLDNREARIRQGISIPISVVSAQGVQTRFFDADLRLTATPHITQDGNIMMQVQITKNEPDFSNRAADGNPTITQREARTELLLGDGETTVIGGIYTRSSSVSIKKVPFFGDLPLLGGLFRSRATEDKRSELLIFITPRIVNRAQSMTVGK